MIHKISEETIKRFCAIIQIIVIASLAILLISLFFRPGIMTGVPQLHTISDPLHLFSHSFESYYYLVHIGFLLILINPLVGLSYLVLRAWREKVYLCMLLALGLILYILITAVIAGLTYHGAQVIMR
ncbi:MAG: hypothetical protein A2Y62_21845 [Candidatus Fischerbacteria bacterium RBG_13_37_8]|uniref:DUF1634 domain-containing protein n=1 Tax=Candidatus Fischerbacteria bacterium RBG_13_37_8 TaxID=1817863 RepID=A0A1F5VTP0_9BACT|nr:MAG: hypothetical protein A2Y62_21845 [Candidatus Fischerbacteria bacterium RBG_13_37_8]